MAKYVEPSISVKSFNCPHCGAHADQTWYTVGAIRIDEKGLPRLADGETLKRVEELIQKSESDEERANWRDFGRILGREYKGDVFFEVLAKWENHILAVRNIHVSECYSCDQISIWCRRELLYPVTNTEYEPNEDLNDDIKRDFREAAFIANLSPRGAAALLRLCIQKLCKQVGEKGKDVNADIANLVKKGLDAEVQKALDIVRVTGNNAVHPGQIDLQDDKKTASELFKLVNIIADTMISQPKRIEAMYESLPEEARDQIEKRDGKS
ncbi:MAG: DUF4145 domain-containing protein [Rhizobiaceae bacterium]